MTSKLLYTAIPTWLIIRLLSISLVTSAQPIDSLKTIAASAKHDTIAIKLYIKVADNFFENNQNDSALFYYNLALNRVKPQFENKIKPFIYHRINRVFYDNGNYSTALSYLFKILVLFENIQSSPYDTLTVNRELAQVYSDIGLNYFATENFHKALEYFEKAILLVEPLNPSLSDKELTRYMFVFTLNMGSVYIALQHYPDAREKFEAALALNQRLGFIEYDAVLYNNLGIIFKEENNLDKAFEFYQKSAEIRGTLRDTAGLAQVYNNIGILDFTRNRYASAIPYLEKALDYSRRSNSIKSEVLAADYLSRAFKNMGVFDKAFEMQSIHKQLNDSILSKEQLEQVSRLELQYLHDREKNILELTQEIEMAKKKRKLLVYMIISGISIFSIIILYLVNRYQAVRMNKMQLEKDGLELEQRNLKLEKQNLEMELEYRNKELTTHVMYLLNKNELLTSITEKLLRIKQKLLPENRVVIQEIIHELETNVDKTVWEEFELRFQNVQQDFYDKLHAKYPNLTPNEVKLSAFLRLNMTTKEISSITLQSVKSIEMARIRLRRKMGISRDQNLTQLLQEI